MYVHASLMSSGDMLQHSVHEGWQLLHGSIRCRAGYPYDAYSRLPASLFMRMASLYTQRCTHAPCDLCTQLWLVLWPQIRSKCGAGFDLFSPRASPLLLCCSQGRKLLLSSVQHARMASTQPAWWWIHHTAHQPRRSASCCTSRCSHCVFHLRAYQQAAEA